MTIIGKINFEILLDLLLDIPTNIYIPTYKYLYVSILKGMKSGYTSSYILFSILLLENIPIFCLSLPFKKSYNDLKYYFSSRHYRLNKICNQYVITYDIIDTKFSIFLRKIFIFFIFNYINAIYMP